MKFVIQGLKYDTDKMKKIANVKKWYETNSRDEYPLSFRFPVL